jgi:hypothetical protein
VVRQKTVYSWEGATTFLLRVMAKFLLSALQLGAVPPQVSQVKCSCSSQGELTWPLSSEGVSSQPLFLLPP